MAESELILANSMGLSSNSLAMIHFMGGTIEDLTMEVIVSGVDILPYIAEDGIEVTLRAIDGDEAGRTMDAYMWRDLKAYKLDISITCRKLPILDALRVCTAIMPEYVPVTIVTPFTGRITAQFYSNNIPCLCAAVGGHGETLWNGIKFPLIQR